MIAVSSVTASTDRRSVSTPQSGQRPRENWQAPAIHGAATKTCWSAIDAVLKLKLGSFGVRAVIRADRGNRITLLGRAVCILADHGISLVVTSRPGGVYQFEIDHRAVREIDVIVHAATLDMSLLVAEPHPRSRDGENAA